MNNSGAARRCPASKVNRANLGRQLGATLGPPGFQDGAAASSGHPSTKAMLLRATTNIWLKCALHGETFRSPPN